MYPAFFMPAEAAGRQGRGVSHTPSSHAPVYGANACSSCSNTVSSSFKHHSNVIQIRPCGPSVRAYAIRPYSGTRIMYPAFLTGVPDASGLCRGKEAGRVPQKPVPSKLRRHPASAEAGKLAGYLKSPYQANFAGVRRRLRPLPRQESWPGISKARTKQTSPASVDAPRARKVSKRAAERFRGLGKLQNTPLNVSEASESIKTRR